VDNKNNHKGTGQERPMDETNQQGQPQGGNKGNNSGK